MLIRVAAPGAWRSCCCAQQQRPELVHFTKFVLHSSCTAADTHDDCVPHVCKTLAWGCLLLAPQGVDPEEVHEENIGDVMAYGFYYKKW